MKSLNFLFILSFLIVFQVKLKGQDIGLSVNRLNNTVSGFHSLRVSPPQYKAFIKHFPIVNYAVFTKNTTLLPTKIPSIYNVDALPFFCKIEHKMALDKKMPVKFRLGTVQYVDELEGYRDPRQKPKKKAK